MARWIPMMMLVIGSLALLSCANGNSGPADLTPDMEAELTVAALVRMCEREPHCLDGSQLYVWDPPPEVGWVSAQMRDAVLDAVPGAVLVTDAQIDQLLPPEGVLEAGGTVVYPGPVTLARRGVVEVEMGWAQGQTVGGRRAYVFRWEDDQWLRTSHTAVGLTTTTADP